MRFRFLAEQEGDIDLIDVIGGVVKIAFFLAIFAGLIWFVHFIWRLT